MTHIYLDIETLDSFSDPHIRGLHRSRQVAAMRFGCGITILGNYNQPENTAAWKAENAKTLWQTLQGKTVVGWNIISFDLPILERAAGETDNPYYSFQPLDLFALIRDASNRWYKLDDVARANLGKGKTANGGDAPAWLRSGDDALIQKAFDYCEADTRIVADLHAKLLDGQSLLLPPRPRPGEGTWLQFWMDPMPRVAPLNPADIPPSDKAIAFAHRWVEQNATDYIDPDKAIDHPYDLRASINNVARLLMRWEQGNDE